jgi:hypothetical protein
LSDRQHSRQITFENDSELVPVRLQRDGVDEPANRFVRVLSGVPAESNTGPAITTFWRTTGRYPITIGAIPRSPIDGGRFAAAGAPGISISKQLEILPENASLAGERNPARR